MTVIVNGCAEQLYPAGTDPAEPAADLVRRGGIGASEIASVLGISPWESKFALWHRKAGNLRPRATDEQMQWGKDLETAIIARWRRRHPEARLRRCGLLAHRERPWQLASPDMLIVTAVAPTRVTAPGSLEAKKDDSGGRWTPDAPPEYVVAQAIWQADVLGTNAVQVPALISGTWTEYTVAYDAWRAAQMREAAAEFLESVAAGEPPPLDWMASTGDALKALHPDVVAEAVTVPAEVAEAARAAHADLEAAKRGYRLHEHRLRAAMGDAKWARDPDGNRVASRSVYEVREHHRKASRTDKIVITKGPTA